MKLRRRNHVGIMQQRSLRAVFLYLDLKAGCSIITYMLAIKLQRIGKKHQPSYRLVVAEGRSKMAAPPVEDLGSYNPFTKAMTVKKDRVSHWVKMGAQPTVSVHNLLVGQGVITTPKIKVKMPKAVAKVAEPVAEVKAPEIPVEEPVTEELVTEPAAPAEESPAPETETAA